MAEHRDPVMEGVLGVLRAADEGISVSELLERLGDDIKNDEKTKSEIWATLVARSDVIEVDKQLPLSQSALKQVTLQFLLDYGLGGTRIQLQRQNVSVGENGAAAMGSPVEDNVVLARDRAPLTENGNGDEQHQQLDASIESDRRPVATETPAPPNPQKSRSRGVQGKSSPCDAPKRRGRPPRPSIHDELAQDEPLPEHPPPPHDYEAGDPGVYINPPGSEVRKSGSGSCIAVFKSAALKDPERLEREKGKWKAHVMLAVAKAKLALEDKVAQNYTKSGRLRRSGRPNKNAQKRKGDQRDDSDGDDDSFAREHDRMDDSKGKSVEPPISSQATSVEVHGKQFGSPPPPPSADKPGHNKRRKRTKESQSVHWAPLPNGPNPWEWSNSWTKEKQDKYVEDTEHEALLREQSYTPDSYQESTSESSTMLSQGAPAMATKAGMPSEMSHKVATQVDQPSPDRQAIEEAVAIPASILTGQPPNQTTNGSAQSSRSATPNSFMAPPPPLAANLTPDNPFCPASPSGSSKNLSGSAEPHSPALSALNIDPSRTSYAPSLFQRPQTPTAVQPFQSINSQLTTLGIGAAGCISAQSGSGRVPFGALQVLAGVKPTGFVSPSTSPDTSFTAVPENEQRCGEQPASPLGHADHSVPARPISQSLNSSEATATSTALTPSQTSMAQRLTNNHSTPSTFANTAIGHGLLRPVETPKTPGSGVRGRPRGRPRGSGKARGRGARGDRGGKQRNAQIDVQTAPQDAQVLPGAMGISTTLGTTPIPPQDTAVATFISRGGVGGRGKGRGAARGRGRGGSRVESNGMSMESTGLSPQTSNATIEQPPLVPEAPQVHMASNSKKDHEKSVDPRIPNSSMPPPISQGFQFHPQEPFANSMNRDRVSPQIKDASNAAEIQAGSKVMPEPTAASPLTNGRAVTHAEATSNAVVSPSPVPHLQMESAGAIRETVVPDVAMIDSSVISQVADTSNIVANITDLPDVPVLRHGELDEPADVSMTGTSVGLSPPVSNQVESQLSMQGDITVGNKSSSVNNALDLQLLVHIHEPANLPTPQAIQTPVDPGKSKKRKVSAVTAGTPSEEPPKKKPVLKSALRKAELERLQAEILEAEKVQMPDAAARFSCSYQDKVGNLFLSKDQKVAEFFALEQHPPQMPLVRMRIAHLIGNPTVSVKGSYPMVLQAKTLCDDKSDAIHRFVFAATDSGNASASHMRQMLTGAIVLHEMEGGDYATIQETKVASEKPFQCHLCKGRFKNPNGLEYHITKARTTCNPNYVPERDVDKRSQRSLKSGNMTRKPKKKVVQWKPAEDEKEDVAIDLFDDLEDKASSGGESIVEWWEKNNTATNETPKNATKPGKRYMALHREGEIAAEIISGLPEIGLVEAEPLPDNFIKLDLVNASGVADSMSCNELHDAWYEEVVVSLVKNNGNVFAADRSVWFASVAVWLKQHPVTNILPESKLCAKAVDDVVRAKTLNRVEFSYVSRKSRVVTRSIITSPGVGLDNARVELFQALIQEYHPQYYVPSQFAPSPPILDLLQNVASRALHRRPVEETLVEDDLESDPDLQPGAGDGFIDDDEDSAADADEFLIDDIEEADEDEQNSDEDIEDDLTVGLRTPGKKRRRRSVRSLSASTTKKRDPSHNAKIAAGVRRKMEAIRSGAQPSPYPWMIKRASLTKEEKERRAAEDKKFFAERAAYRAMKQQCWENAPAFMPNTTSGAWDQVALPQKTEKPARMSKRARYPRRSQLPEPITFMQALDGSWSVRPFGHGVNPVYGRPARRAAGNLGYEAYRKRREDGHRPLIEPPISNRVHLPQPPSKRLMDAIRQGIPLDPETGLPAPQPKARRKRRNSQRATSTPFSVLESDDYSDEESEGYEENPSKRQKTVDALPGTSAKRPRAAHSSKLTSMSPGFDEMSDARNALEASVRLSKATGKPVRGYNRRFAKQVFVQDLNDINDAFEPKGSRFVQRNGSKRLKGLSEVDILNFYEPKKLGPKDIGNPGLDSLPAVFGLSNSKIKTVVNYPTKIEFVAFVDAEAVAEGKDPYFGSWRVDRMNTDIPKDYSVRWDDATAFTVEDLPYLKLESDDSERLGYAYEETNDAAVAKVKRKRSMKPSAFPITSVNAKQDEKFNYTRLQTALPSDLADTVDPAIATQVFGVELGRPNEVTVKRSRNLGSNVLLSELENRFIVTVTVIRTLTGGLDAQVDWVLVAELFPQYSLNFLTKTWKNLLAVKKPAIKELEEEFRKVFLEAYENGEIPPLNYNKLTEYPWSTVVDWVMDNVESSLSNKKVPLPGTKAELDYTYEVVPFKEHEKEVVTPWREHFFHPSMAVYKRFEGAASEALTMPVGRSRIKDEVDYAAVVRSWIRAAAATPDDEFDAALAKAKMDSFRPAAVKQAINECLDNKCITRRKITKSNKGKSFLLVETWTNKFRRHIKDPQFVEATLFKRWMDDQFRSGARCIKGDYFANEGALMVLTSMQAHGRLKFVGVNVPKNRFGLGDGGYETKKIPKEAFIWNIDIYPTESYVFDDANPVLQRFELMGPPRGGENGEIPIWFSINEEVIPEVWNRVIAGVAQVVALRAGIGLDGLKSSFKEALEEWEWKLLMQWGVEMGVFVDLGAQAGVGVEAYTAGEWWWAVVGTGCADALQSHKVAGAAPEGDGGAGDAVMGGV